MQTKPTNDHKGNVVVNRKEINSDFVLHKPENQGFTIRLWVRFEFHASTLINTHRKWNSPKKRHNSWPRT